MNRGRRTSLRRWICQKLVPLLLLALSLSLAADRLHSRKGRLFVAVFLARPVTVALILVPASSELLAELAGIKSDAKRWAVSSTSEFNLPARPHRL